LFVELAAILPLRWATESVLELSEVEECDEALESLPNEDGDGDSKPRRFEKDPEDRIVPVIINS
jgi:hypothetical protein